MPFVSIGLGVDMVSCVHLILFFLFDCVHPLDVIHTLFPCSLAKQRSHKPRELLIFIMMPVTCEKKYWSKY
jgi:hypothetical protein